MNAKEYMQIIRQIAARVKLLQAEVERLRADAESVAINLDGMPKGTGKGDRLERLAIQLAEAESALQTEMSVLWSEKIKAIELLGLLQSKHQAILTARYLDCKKWEQIAYEMDISWRYCYILHGYALAELDKVLKRKKN